MYTDKDLCWFQRIKSQVQFNQKLDSFNLDHMTSSFHPAPNNLIKYRRGQDKLQSVPVVLALYERSAYPERTVSLSMGQPSTTIQQGVEHFSLSLAPGVLWCRTICRTQSGHSSFRLDARLTECLFQRAAILLVTTARLHTCHFQSPHSVPPLSAIMGRFAWHSVPQ